jgi:hypothetical protein
MLWVLQIAVGMVLAAVVLRYLEWIVAATVLGAAGVAMIVLAALGWSVATEHWDVILATLASTAALVAVHLVIKRAIQRSPRGNTKA